MKKAWGIAVAASLIGSIAAQAVDKKRIEVIDTAIHNRFVDQSNLWWEDGDYPRVIQLLWILFEADPTDYEQATNLGWMLGNVEEYAAELAVYVRFRQENPTAADAAFPEANFYWSKKAYQKIPPLLEGTLKRSPHPNSYRLLANSYDRMGLFGDAKRVWQTYLAKYPNDLTAKARLRSVEKKINDSR